MTVLRVQFQGQEYLLIGTLEGGGALATAEEFGHCLCSFAHLKSDGRICRFADDIGTRADLTVLGECDAPALADDAWANLLVAEMRYAAGLPPWPDPKVVVSPKGETRR